MKALRNGINEQPEIDIATLGGSGDVEDYPAEGENLTVAGRYDLYEENGL